MSLRSGKEYKMADTNLILKRLEEMNGTLLNVQTTVQTINDNYDKSIVPRLTALETEVNNIKTEVNNIKTEVKKLKDKNLQLASYLRRENLIFGGITETEPDDCENQVKFVIGKYLNIDATGMLFQRIHRHGRKQTGKSRPIIVRFALFRDKQAIWAKRSKFKDTNFWVAEDFPEEVIENRKVLLPILKKARQMKPEEKIFLVADRLHIGNQIFSMNNLPNLPKELQPENVATPSVGDNLVAFYSRQSPLSNFYPAKFKIGSKTFLHTEQYFQYMRAEIAGNLDLANQIANESCPVKCKNLGKKAQENDAWKNRQEDVMLEGCTAKFQQNPKIMEFLKDTSPKKLVEARHDDRFWGAGLKVSDQKLLAPPHEWPGQNKLGTILERIRDAL